jgi:hypothetical protein
VATSKRAKGNAFQDWICKYLEKQGWVTHNQKTVAKWLPYKQMWTSCRNDILGVIDIVAVNGINILMIQATMHTGTGRKLSDLRSVPWPYDKVEIQLWQKRAPRRVVVIEVKLDSQRILGEIVNGKWISDDYFFSSTTPNTTPPATS